MATAIAIEPATTSPTEDDYEHYEEIDGVRVAFPPMSAYASRIASRLLIELNAFAHQHNLGEAVSETLFRLPLPRRRNRRPDVAFVSYERWPADRPMRPDDKVWDVVPDLVVEVVSPTDRAQEVVVKLSEYFEAGVRVVWLIYPRPGLVYVHNSATAVEVRGRTDELSGQEFLPGFSLPLARLFPPVEPVAENGETLLASA